mmetsp:Transcript_20609/g.52036  ORF Transcript_20609/g.52036 Transcript_20609/m.52036 type:complete len:343 (+) Transcript_20609:1748-2776(+)
MEAPLPGEGGDGGSADREATKSGGGSKSGGVLNRLRSMQPRFGLSLHTFKLRNERERTSTASLASNMTAKTAGAAVGRSGGAPAGARDSRMSLNSVRTDRSFAGWVGRGSSRERANKLSVNSVKSCDSAMLEEEEHGMSTAAAAYMDHLARSSLRMQQREKERTMQSAAINRKTLLESAGAELQGDDRDGMLGIGKDALGNYNYKQMPTQRVEGSSDRFAAANTQKQEGLVVDAKQEKSRQVTIITPPSSQEQEQHNLEAEVHLEEDQVQGEGRSEVTESQMRMRGEIVVSDHELLQHEQLQEPDPDYSNGCLSPGDRYVLRSLEKVARSFDEAGDGREVGD